MQKFRDAAKHPPVCRFYLSFYALVTPRRNGHKKSVAIRLPTAALTKPTQKAHSYHAILMISISGDLQCCFRVNTTVRLRLEQASYVAGLSPNGGKVIN